MADMSAWRLYWPDDAELICDEPRCPQVGIVPEGRHISVGDLLAAVEEHMREFHPGAPRPR